MDKFSKETRSKIMRAVRQKDTKPEIAVRKLLTALGYRYKLHWKNLPGCPDLAFPGRKKVIFVHGCFWHVHQGCAFSHIPENEYWRQKLAANQARDRKVLERLATLGWHSLTLWECELKDMVATEEKVKAFLGPGITRKSPRVPA